MYSSVDTALWSFAKLLVMVLITYTTLAVTRQIFMKEGHRITHCKNLAVLPFLYLLYVSEMVDKWTHCFLWKYCILFVCLTTLKRRQHSTESIGIDRDWETRIEMGLYCHCDTTNTQDSMFSVLLIVRMLYILLPVWIITPIGTYSQVQSSELEAQISLVITLSSI